MDLFKKHRVLLSSLTKHQIFRDYMSNKTLKLPSGVFVLPNGYVRKVGENIFTLSVAPADIYNKILPALQVVDFFSNKYTTLTDLQKALLYELEQIKLFSNPLGYNPKDYRLRFATFTGSPDQGVITISKNAIASTADSDWAVNHDATAANSVEISSTSTVRLAASGTSNKWSTLIRNFQSYNLAVMGVGADVTGSPTIGLYVAEKTETLASQSYNIYNATFANANAVVAEDFDQAGTTAQATALTGAGITTSAVNNWTLNATGIATLEAAAGSTVKFSVRLVSDAANAEPTWGSAVVANIGFQQAADANPPLLTATYTSLSGDDYAYFL